MDFKATLEKIGLNKKEADIYLTCLEHGPETISNIARLSGYKRPTLYNIIHELLVKGYIILIRRNKKTYYDIVKPKKLLTTLRAREKELEQALPELDAIKRKKQSLPDVQIYEEDNAIKNLYDDIYDQLNAKHETCFLTSVTDAQNYAPFILQAYFVKISKNPNYKIRELIFDDEGGKKYVKELLAKKIKHQIRLLPIEFPIYNDIAIYQDTVAIFSFKNRSTATIINNPEIAKTFKSLFEWAWFSAKQ